MGRRGPKPKYPWGTWLKKISEGGYVRLVEGRQYTCSRRSMEVMLRQRAAVWGVPLTITRTATAIIARRKI